jgi:hypothetical protein
MSCNVVLHDNTRHTSTIGSHRLAPVVPSPLLLQGDRDTNAQHEEVGVSTDGPMGMRAHPPPGPPPLPRRRAPCRSEYLNLYDNVPRTVLLRDNTRHM